MSNKCFSQKHKAFLATVTNHEEPAAYSQAVKHAKWRNDMAHEQKYFKIMRRGN